MKKIQIQNPKRANAKRYLLFTGIFLVLSIIMISNAISNNKKLTEDNFDKVEGIVENIEITEKEYKINIEGQSEILLFNLESDANLPTLKENLNVGDKVSIIYNKDVKEMYKVTIKDTLLYDRLADAIKSNKNLIIFYIIVGVIMLGVAVMEIVVIVKEPASKEIDYIEYVIANNRAVTNTMLKDDSKTMQLVKKDQMLNKGLMFLLVALFIALIFSKSLFNNNLVLLIIAVVVVALIFVLVALLKPKFYSKHLEIFVEDYLDYLNNGSLKEERTLFFEKEQVKVLDKEETYTFDYSELNLFTVCVYSKSQVPVNIFICSQLPDKEEYKNFEDFIIPLSRDLYQDITENAINILGLEEVINNLYQETKTNLTNVKKTISVKYYK